MLVNLFWRCSINEATCICKWFTERTTRSPSFARNSTLSEVRHSEGIFGVIELQEARYVNHTITFFAVFVLRKFCFFRKNRQNFGELQYNSAFSRKSMKIRENLMKICENLDENLIKKANFCELPWKCLQNLQKVWRHFAEILRVERCKGILIW